MTDTRAKQLQSARRELIALPDLMTELDRCLTERRSVEGGGQRKITGSPAPLRVDVLDLAEQRLKSDWHGADPRRPEFGPRTPVVDRFGARWALASWTRIVSEEHPEVVDLADDPTVVTESATLVEYWPWISEQQWADELAGDVLDLATRVRIGLGEVRLLLRCPECADHAFIDGLWLVCDSGHETSVRNLAQQQRRRPPATTQDIAAEFSLTEDAIWQWRRRGKLDPVNPGQKPLLWLPWDVLRILNPDLVEAAEMRDDMPA